MVINLPPLISFQPNPSQGRGLLSSSILISVSRKDPDWSWLESHVYLGRISVPSDMAYSAEDSLQAHLSVSEEVNLTANIYTYIYTHIYVYIYTHIYVCIYMYIHTYICVYLYTYICVYIYVYTHIYMCIFIYTYICIHTHTHTHTHTLGKNIQ